MRYQVIHETIYSYESPVVLSQQLLHLTPRPLPFQAREAHHIAVEPVPAESSTREDYFGNPVTQIVLAAPHASLTVRAESKVKVEARAAPAAAGPPAARRAASSTTSSLARTMSDWARTTGGSTKECFYPCATVVKHSVQQPGRVRRDRGRPGPGSRPTTRSLT